MWDNNACLYSVYSLLQLVTLYEPLGKAHLKNDGMIELVVILMAMTCFIIIISSNY